MRYVDGELIESHIRQIQKSLVISDKASLMLAERTGLSISPWERHVPRRVRLLSSSIKSLTNWTTVPIFKTQTLSEFWKVVEGLNSRVISLMKLIEISDSTDTKKPRHFWQGFVGVGGADGTFYLTLRAARPPACQAAKLSNRKFNQLNYRSNF